MRGIVLFCIHLLVVANYIIGGIYYARKHEVFSTESCKKSE